MEAFTHFVCKTSVALAALCLVPAVSSGSWSCRAQRGEQRRRQHDLWLEDRHPCR